VRAVFGVVSLLVVLAIVGVVAGGVNARDQAQQKARDDVAKALEQGAQNNARSEEASQ